MRSSPLGPSSLETGTLHFEATGLSNGGMAGQSFDMVGKVLP